MPIDYQKPTKKPRINKENGTIVLSGDWTKHLINAVNRKARRLRFLAGKEVTVDGADITNLDTVGAVVIYHLLKSINTKSLSHQFRGFAPEHQALLDLVFDKEESLGHLPKLPEQPTLFESVGKATVSKFDQFFSYLNFFGQVVVMSFHAIRHFTQLQVRSFLNSLYEMGYQALPILALLSFLVGVVIAYQLGVQLQNYGANAFIVNLIGQAIFREFGPLITAIIGAGRTSAALTAQIGAMKLNEEIDALRTMGFSPFDILVIPRVMASLVVFPLLIIWADIFGVLGGMIMTKILYGMSYPDFLGRFNDVINTTTLLIGLSKAPVFALIITMVGCFQGFHVSNNADSIGVQTTKSVVQAIFLIIIADAIYSIIYSRLNL